MMHEVMLLSTEKFFCARSETGANAGRKLRDTLHVRRNRVSIRSRFTCLYTGETNSDDGNGEKRFCLAKNSAITHDANVPYRRNDPCRRRK